MTHLEYAIRYARAGLAVFPLKPRTKVPMTRHGVKDATTDEARIRQWWGRCPDANIGMALDGLVAVDFDPRAGGDVDTLLARDLPDACVAATGGGGWHYLYRAAAGVRYPGKLAPGIDIKAGPGQYIVVAPSIHPNGERYSWRAGCAPWEKEPAAAPESLVHRARTTTQRTAVAAEIPEGERNNTLTSLAGSMRRPGMSVEAINAALLVENEARCCPPLEDEEVKRIAESVGRYPPATEPAPPSAKSPDDFYAYLPDHKYIFRPTRELWRTASVNSLLPPMVVGRDTISPSEWLDQHRAVEQITWVPGQPETIEDAILDQGGLVERAGVRAYNLYRAPTIIPGDSHQAARWREHLRRLYPEEAEHLERWFAHRLQAPGEKINHALVLAGEQGIGKDTLLEPVKHGVGPWNWSEISPGALMGRFNGWAKAVVVRVSEVRDLGEVNRFAFYEHTKTYAVSPPDVLRVDEKNLREHYIMNALGLVMTTNHALTGMYLPADDRRHFVAASNVARVEFDEEYFPGLFDWYERGGIGHVVAFFRGVDLRGFNPKAPPPKTTAWRRLVQANAAPEESELGELIDSLGSPPAITLDQLRQAAAERQSPVHGFLLDRAGRRQIPHRMAECGYDQVSNPDRPKDGLWLVANQRVTVYARRELPVREQVLAVRALTRKARQ